MQPLLNSHASTVTLLRNETVDVAKGIGILLVVLWHTRLGFLAPLDMPLFFFISGFFAPSIRKYSFVEGFKKRTRELLPTAFKYLVFFGVLAYLMARLPYSGLPRETFFFWLTPEMLFIRPFIDLNPVQPWAGTIWFITALWLGMIWWLLFREVVENYAFKNRKNTALVISFFIFLYYSCIFGPGLKADPNHFYACFYRSIYAFVFISLGHIAYRYKDRLLYGDWRWIVVLLAVSAIYWKIIYWGGFPRADVRSMEFAHVYRFKTLFVTFGGISLVFVSALTLKTSSFLKGCFTYLGRKSYHIMALHMLGIYLIQWLFRMCGVDQWKAFGYLQTRWLIFFFALLFSLLCIYLWDILTAGKKNIARSELATKTS